MCKFGCHYIVSGLDFSLLPAQYLPKEELYAPPLNIRILDKRNFGRMPMVGTHIIKSLKDFHVEPVLSPEERAALKGACACMFDLFEANISKLL